MKIINKYFFKQLLIIFTLLLIILTGLTWFLQLISMMKFLVNHGVDIPSFIKMTIFMIPFIISIIIPFITFITIIYTYNKLITENEIIVLVSAGLSKKQIVYPALIIVSIITFVHFLLNIWITPFTQSKFYNTQWNLKYGLAHLKIQESAFTYINKGLIVYVDKVSNNDLLNIMLNDLRNPKSEITIFSKKGKLVNINDNLSLIMNKGSLQIRNKYLTTGTFNTFDMKLDLIDKSSKKDLKIKSISTLNLINLIKIKEINKLMYSELGNRILNPIMNIILTLSTLYILLKSSLLRRRISLSPLFAILAMAFLMTLFMSSVNTINSIFGFFIILFIQIILLIIFGFKLLKK